tara:strand:+ start:903 stop:1721 length:819 start_codon:yes stop_codon:yes gene_type:complete
MKTNNIDIINIINYLTDLINKSFKNNNVSIYIMGSLARGGFSEIASDIDLGIVLKGSLDHVQKRITVILTEAKKKFPGVKNNISVFWGSIESINGQIEGGRYPPFDRLDLINHALLLSGQDIRKLLIKPTKKELEIASAIFSINNLATKERVNEFFDCSSIIKKGLVYTTKTILFPARFIYLEKTGEIAGNKESVRYYQYRFKGPSVKLIELGYFWRNNALPHDLNMASHHISMGLRELYINYINIYQQNMEKYNEIEIVDKLTQWKKEITA